MDIVKRLELHKKFWNGEELQTLPVSFRIGDYFFADKFAEAKKLLRSGGRIESESICVDAFLEDFERMYEEIENIGQTGFWTAEPFIGIPWIEAILGCPVYAGDRSFVTEPVKDLKEITFDRNDPWLLKYIEFARKLNNIAGDRFPIGQPIIRGVADTLGALIGQEQLVFGMYDESNRIKELSEQVKTAFLELITIHNNNISDFHGGYSLGFYHIWMPEKGLWFQEDLTTLLSPGLYREYIMEHNIEISKKYKYSAIHMHPSSFHILDDVLEIEELKAIEINKDVGGPSIEDMMPILKKIISKNKCLVLWGSIDEYDIEVLYKELPKKRVFLNIIVESQDRAKRLIKYL